jgi:DNA-binding IclR family transcriptional regulator
MSTIVPRRGREGMSKGIQSIEIGARLLDALIETRQPMRLKELSEQAGLSASKARMYLVSLIRTGLIRQDDANGLYAPGPKAMRLGMVALGQDRLFTAARDLVHTLGRETGHPVLLSYWDGTSPVVLASSESPDALPIAFRTGARTPLWTTATGAVFLAFLPHALVERLIDKECPPEPRDGVRAEIARTMADGYRFFELVRLNREVALTGYGAIAAPIFGRDGGLEFVVTMLVPTGPRKGKPSKLIALLQERTRQLSQDRESQPARGPGLERG